MEYQLYVRFNFGLSLLQVCSLKTVDMNIDNREKLKVLTGLWEMQASLLGKKNKNKKQTKQVDNKNNKSAIKNNFTF